MLTITITLIDPDFDYSLPARWGTDYKVSAIQGCFLNGATALVLSLSPLKDENLPEFSQGRSPIPFDLRRISFPKSPYSWYKYIDILKCTVPLTDDNRFCSLYRVDTLQYTVPLAVGSSYGSSYRISEVKQVTRTYWKLHQDQWQYEWCLCWRYTLAPRRDPILLLPSAI